MTRSPVRCGPNSRTATTLPSFSTAASWSICSRTGRMSGFRLCVSSLTARAARKGACVPGFRCAVGRRDLNVSDNAGYPRCRGSNTDRRPALPEGAQRIGNSRVAAVDGRRLSAHPRHSDALRRRTAWRDDMRLRLQRHGDEVMVIDPMAVGRIDLDANGMASVTALLYPHDRRQTSQPPRQVRHERARNGLEHR